MALYGIEPVDPGEGTGNGGGGGGYNPGAGTEILSLTIQKADSSSLLRVLAFMNCASPDDLVFTAYVLVDGQVAQIAQTNMIFANRKAVASVCVPAYLGGLSAGQHTISLKIQNKETDGALTINTGASLEVTELRAPSM